MKHPLKVGQEVTVLNQSMNGAYVIEGKAVIKKHDEVADLYEVHFEDDQEGESYLRFLYPENQDNPEATVKEMNEAVSAS